jgi:hypothetical protein
MASTSPLLSQLTVLELHYAEMGNLDAVTSIVHDCRASLQRLRIHTVVSQGAVLKGQRPKWELPLLVSFYSDLTGEGAPALDAPMLQQLVLHLPEEPPLPLQTPSWPSCRSSTRLSILGRLLCMPRLANS